MKVIVTATGEYDPIAEIQEISFCRTISKYPVLSIVKLLINGYLSCSSGGGRGGLSGLKMYTSMVFYSNKSTK